MTDDSSRFVHGISRIKLHQGAVHIEFAEVDVLGDGAERGTPVHLVTTIEGFASCYKTMGKMLEKLIEDGRVNASAAADDDP